MATPKSKHSLAAKTNKNLPKLKCILAQPFRRYCPTISEQEAHNLKSLVITDMKAKNESKTVYRKTRVQLGLEKCLEAVNSGSFSCVLISTDVKPKFITAQILHLIAINEQKPKGFCVPNLEAITHQLFGLKSLALAFPKDVSEDICEWFGRLAKRFPIPKHLLAKENQIQIPTSENITKKEETETVDFEKIYLRSNGQKRAFEPKTVHKYTPMEVEGDDDNKEWSGDYISFSDAKSDNFKTFTKQSYETDKSKMMDVFDMLTKSPVEKKDDKSVIVEEQVLPKKPKIEDKNLGIKYIGLKVNKIQGNPNRKNNSKKNKKKNKK